jgi:hypothetical protein
MNAAQARAFLAAAAASDPKGDYSGPLRLIEAASAAPGCEWQVAVRGDDSNLLRLVLPPSGAPGARAALAVALAVEESLLPERPAVSRPWLDAVWSARARSWTKVEVSFMTEGGERTRAVAPRSGAARDVRVGPFSAGAFEEPISTALRSFHALEPLATIQRIDARPGWTLILAKSAPWHRFLRSDLAASFAPRAAQLSLLLRDARVAALDFDGEALWARLV